MLRGVILTEGRAASGGRAELFAPGSVVWPSDRIGILTEHRATGEVRAVPTRDQATVEIRVEARATDAIRRAVDVAGRIVVTALADQFLTSRVFMVSHVVLQPHMCRFRRLSAPQI